MNPSRIGTYLILATLAMLWGCAGSAPKPQFTDTVAEHKKLDGNDIATVNVQTAEGVSMLGVDMQRLTELIHQQLAAKQALNPAAGEADGYDVNVVITKYAKGNAFARLMLVGLGQIHLDGKITVTPSGTQETTSEFTVKKTFAWGGIYGGTTRIEDVEPAFAEGVAAGVTGQMDSSEKKGKESMEAGK